LKLRTSEKSDYGIAELRLWSNISLKSFGIAIAEVQYFLQVAELRLRTQKKVARAHLCRTLKNIYVLVDLEKNLLFRINHA
jgi:hypothetical protein